MALKDGLTQAAIDWIEILYEYEGASSGELALITEESPSAVKRWMKWAEHQKLGEFTIQDGMFHFWFSPRAKQEIAEWYL